MRTINCRNWRLSHYFLDTQIGSPTALSDPVILQTIKTAANSYNGVYIAIGALWGGHDIQRMADRGTLKVL